MKRIKPPVIALTLIIMMLSTSCKSDQTIKDNTSDRSQNTTTAVENSTSMYEADELPELDYGGDDFTIFVEDYGGYSASDFFVESENGDIVNDAVYKRNQAVRDRLNLNIIWKSFTHAWDNRAEYINMLRSSVMAGDSAYDLTTGLGYFVPGFVTDNILLAMNDLPYINVDKPWWAKAFMENSAADGKYYFVTGDASLGLIKNMFCVYVNLDLLKNLGINENPYQLVYDGKWTLDKLAEISRAQYSDLNGDDKTDSDDRFGMLVNSGNHITGFMESLGVSIVDFDNGQGNFVFGNEHNAEVVQKLVDIIMNTPGIYYDTKGEAETADNSLFKKGNILFATGWLMHTDTYRGLDFDYGVLPYPKWDESQSNYKTTVLTSYSVLSIPSDCKDKERAAAVIEALGSESYRTVTPAYFETALKIKYARDNDTAKMFDIIKAGVDFDFGYIYTISMDGVTGQFHDAIRNKNGNWVSTIASLQDKMTDKLNTLLSSIRENEE